VKKIVRVPLGQQILDHLSDRQSKVDAEPDLDSRVARARTLWDGKKKSAAGREAFTNIDRALSEMCNGPQLCMYCEVNEGTDIEHVRPKSDFPEVAFAWDNYLLACPVCNSRFKQDRYHPGFMDPSQPGYDLWQRWLFDAGTGHYYAVSETDEGASQTLEILGFTQRQSLAERRKSYLTTLVVGIREYAKARARGRDQEARKMARSFRQLFPAVVEWVLTTDPSPDIFPDSEVVSKVKKRFPEIIEDALG
jgi:hypothetical protein